MELKVERIGDGFGVLLPTSLMAEMSVQEGSLLRAESHDGVLRMTPVDPEFASQVEAFLRTEQQHQRSYRELAK